MTLSRVGASDVLTWDRNAAERYGTVRAEMERKGRPLAPLDMQIAAHALCLGSPLIRGC